ncbi:MAG TPA: thioredoxin family protein [Burkholderiales bacterium]|nr:thioredoxin family protein [Burkholderiales bacterium]
MKAPQFDLLGVDGKRHGPASARGAKGLVVMFICNHCPYVKRSLDRILSDCRSLAAQGIGSIAVMSNDPTDYPEDSFENMKRVAREKGFPFPYVVDETQDVARAYDAVCTPDFLGFDSNLDLRYHGRLEELMQAMTGTPPSKQVASIGCSIKWKT